MARKTAKETAAKYNLQIASEMPDLDYVPTGLGDLDKLTKGFPRKRISELFGLQGVGKTTLTLMSIAASTKKGYKCLFIDCENAFNPGRATELGVDLKKLTLIQESRLDVVHDILMDQIPNFDMIIVDSVAAMVPMAELEGESGDANVGLKARLLGQLIRKVNVQLGNSNCALIFINQLRESMEMFAPKFSTTGGNALRFFASLRIEVVTTSKDRIEKTKAGVKERIGHRVTAKIIKSRNSKPYQTAQFELIY